MLRLGLRNALCFIRENAIRQMTRTAGTEDITFIQLCISAIFHPLSLQYNPSCPVFPVGGCVLYVPLG
uniref:Uncharacterized protein n=1 Tax=Anguilla anguilla TaxID=7936 RepID=A0A0E9TAI1_ANGAN